MLTLGLFAVSTSLAQGIRGVTRRMPTVVPGQTASQFFAAGGLPLNPANPALATIPGAPQNTGAGNRGFVSAPMPAIRPNTSPNAQQTQRPAPGLPQAGPVYSASPSTTPVGAHRR